MTVHAYSGSTLRCVSGVKGPDNYSPLSTQPGVVTYLPPIEVFEIGIKIISQSMKNVLDHQKRGHTSERMFISLTSVANTSIGNIK